MWAWVRCGCLCGGDEFASAPHTGRGVFGDGEFWSDVVESDTVEVAYIPAPDANPFDEPPFTIDAISHQWSGPAPPGDAEPAQGPNFDSAASCNLDATCYPAYQSMAKGAVQYSYIGDDGGAYVCSGSMVNTRGGSFKPYFLTAHHCIGSAAEARSIAARFFYQTSTCNGSPPSLSSVPTVLGGTYLAGAPTADGDYSFVLLNSVPAGVWFLGWNTSLDPGASVVGIHHPRGSYKRISFGTREMDQTVNVAGELAPAGSYYNVKWSSGLTEPGSSGSPLLNPSGQIVGTLTAGLGAPPGMAACEAPASSAYGRFGNAFSAIKPYLEDTPPSGLTVSPSSLMFQVTDGVVAPPAMRTVVVTTQSQTSLPITVRANQTWIRVAGPAVVSAASPANLAISIDPISLVSAGSYSGAITVSSTSTSTTIAVQATVTITRSNVTVTVSPNPVYEQAPDADGYAWSFTVRINELAGVSARLTGFRIDGLEYSSEISRFFGTTNLPGFGALSSLVRSRGLSVPVTRTFEIDGVDTGTTRPWRVTAQVPFLGRKGQPVIVLTNSPEPVRQNTSAPADCQWSHDLTLRETAGFPVQLTRFVAGGHDLSGKIADYFGSARLAANGSLTTGLCWASVSVPTTLMFEIGGIGDSGAPVSAQVNARFLGPLAAAPSLSVSPTSVSITTAAPSAQVHLSFGGTPVFWTASVSAQGSQPAWLTAYPLSGSGAGAITLTAQPVGLAPGRYSAHLVIQALNATPQVMTVPVTLEVARPNTVPLITAMLNGASYAQGASPGMLMSIFGTNLAPQTAQASGIPLPTSLAGVSVAFNGVKAPLYFVSPTQLNVQVPFEAAPPQTNVTVTVDGQTGSAPLPIAESAPGIFTDGARIVPYPTCRPGDILILYITGQGVVTPSVPTGNAPALGTPVDRLPQPVGPVGLKIGGLQAEILFVGIPPGLVGVTQINFKVPDSAPSGDQPVVVTVGGRQSQAARLTVL